jgi:hypothetical protein
MRYFLTIMLIYEKTRHHHKHMYKAHVVEWETFSSRNHQLINELRMWVRNSTKTEKKALNNTQKNLVKL